MMAGPIPDKFLDEIREVAAARDRLLMVEVEAMVRGSDDLEALRSRVAQFICNGRHSGIDVWSMIQRQPDRLAHWLSVADSAIASVEIPNA